MNDGKEDPIPTDHVHTAPDGSGTMNSTAFCTRERNDGSGMRDILFNSLNDGLAHGHVVEYDEADGSRSYAYVSDVEGVEYNVSDSQGNSIARSSPDSYAVSETIYRQLNEVMDRRYSRRTLLIHLKSLLAYREEYKELSEVIAYQIAGFLSTKFARQLKGDDPLLTVLLLAGELELPEEYRSSATWDKLKIGVESL